MKKILIAFLLLFSYLCFGQQVVNKNSDAWKTMYRATSTKVNDLVNTKLDVTFDFSKAWMYGKEWITLKPHFYPTDSLTLDAKRMNVREVSMFRDNRYIPLKFKYDTLKLHITLDRIYNGGENYTIFIDYKNHKKQNDGKFKYTNFCRFNLRGLNRL